MKIEINLIPGGKKKKRSAGAGFQMPNIGELVSQIKDPLLLGAVGAWVVGLGAVAGIYFMEKDRVADLEPLRRAAANEARQFQVMTAERDRFQDLRDSLVAELEAIRDIDADRFIWPHIMEEVTKALPQFTWIVSLRYEQAAQVFDAQGIEVEQPLQFTLDGRTSDMQAFTRFVTQLESSPWFRDVRTGGANAVQEEERSVLSFSISGSFQVADSAFIRTVPVSESVR